jgi:diguanylate cyclase (GGDEF)-like protein
LQFFAVLIGAQMNFAFLPDLSALAILIGILLLLRRSVSDQRTNLWLLGLLITLVESMAHIFYAPTGIPAAFLHVIVIDCYVLAGIVFSWAGAGYALSNRPRMLYLVLNGLCLLTIATFYGLNIRSTPPYLPVIVTGMVVGVVTSIYLRKSPVLAIAHLIGWMALSYLVIHSKYREAVYWSLCCIYVVAALNFQRSLPSRSTGRLAILTGFYIWALCFFVHPWIIDYYASYADIASHVWNMQKSLISIGMILVMLEEQVASNQWLALHDELTGLPNRRLFEERLTHALDRCRRTGTPMALLLLDLDGFKKINDSFGHQAGDQVLREVAHNLRETLHTTDTLARIGGDEFVLLTTSLADHHAIGHRVDAIQFALARPILLSGRPTSVSASLGTAVYPADGADATALMHIADQRMYALKLKPVPRSTSTLRDVRPQPSQAPDIRATAS